MRDRYATAIAVHVSHWSWTKPSDIHVARGDLELANGERHGSVDSKLVLLVAVRVASRLRRQLIEPACRNRVPHIAGSHRQELCHPNREVNLCDGYLQVADEKPGEFESDLFVAPGYSLRPRPRARRSSPVHRRHQVQQVAVGASTLSWAAHGAASDITQTTKALRTRYRAHVVSFRISISASGDGNGDAAARIPREHARIGVLSTGRRADDCVVSRGACDNTQRIRDNTTPYTHTLTGGITLALRLSSMVRIDAANNWPNDHQGRN